MAEKRKITYDEIFSLSLEELTDIVELHENSDAHKTRDVISDYNQALDDAIVDFLKNVHICERGQTNKFKSVRMGFGSSKSATRQVLREHFSSEKLYALGNVATLIGCDMENCPLKKTFSGGLEGLLRSMPGVQGAVSIDASKLPPELLQRFQGLLQKMAEAADTPAGEVTKMGDLELRKPPKPDKLLTEMEEVDRQIDEYERKKREGKTPDAKE